MQAQTETAQPYAPVFLRAVLWLIFLAPFFYLTYGYANALAAQQADVGHIVFAWERYVQFVAWTIVPYWSINLFYGLSLAINSTPSGVNRLAGRYLTAQLVAVTCFILFPLTATFVRPPTEGIPGMMFAVLGGFDKPFNQAPSLHIALLVIIWDHLRSYLRGPLATIWHGWCLLIGVSVLTTWQHHFIDIPTGALLGLFALWLFPKEGALPLAGARLTGDPKARRLAARYGIGACVLLAAAWVGAYASPLWLILLWPSLSLAIVALGYALRRPEIFQKALDGTVSLASRWLLWPYRVGARMNVWAWTRSLPPDVAIAEGMHLGRFPGAAASDRYATVIDLAAELEKPSGAKCKWLSFPMLDLVAAPKAQILIAAQEAERGRQSGPVLICCALGFQRSAGVAVEWLVLSGRARDHAEALALLAQCGRPVHVHPVSVTAGHEAVHDTAPFD